MQYSLAKALAKEGHKIALPDLNKEAADQLAKEIEVSGGITISIPTNVKY